MDRRAYLAGCVGLLTGLSGCSAAQDGAGGGPATPSTPTPTPTATTRTTTRQPSDRTPEEVPLGEMTRALGPDVIPAITEPAFGADWSGIEMETIGPIGVYTSRPRLLDNDRVIGVERDGEARAYPLRLLEWHEVVNDEFGGPLLVTYCPLCGSGIVAERLIAGEPAEFGVSGLLWKEDLVMYDSLTDSLWSQIEARAINGPAVGTDLTLVPSTFTTWDAWRDAHPDTVVLRPPPDSETVTGGGTGNLDTGAYGGYASSDRIGLTNGEFTDDRLHPKTQVLGVEHDGVARAYPLPAVEEAGVVNDRVGSLPVVVTVGPGDQLVGYSRRVDGETLTFSTLDGTRMRAGGSRWSVVDGRALDGPHAGARLAPASDRTPLFWFAWLSFFPETEVYG